MRIYREKKESFQRKERKNKKKLRNLKKKIHVEKDSRFFKKSIISNPFDPICSTQDTTEFNDLTSTYVSHNIFYQHLKGLKKYKYIFILHLISVFKLCETIKYIILYFLLKLYFVHLYFCQDFFLFQKYYKRL